MPKAVSHASTKPNIIKMYATTWCIDCYMAKRWFDSHGVPYEYINIAEDERAAEYVLRVNGGMQSVPTIVFPDGSILVEPSVRELAAKVFGEQSLTLRERIRNLYRRAEQ